MRYLSLFDGMACGHIASQLAEIAVESYDAYEIDKYAALTATHNFPDIVEHGDVFAEDFTKYRGKVDFLIGGSPCTYWSIAQTNNRETEASGLGWELFSQYVRALRESEPRYFIYENNKSMSKAIRDSIREAFGFEEICINSALVSAQNRQRYYWVGKRNPDGTYSKVPVEQPADRGILLKDVLDGVCREEPESRLAPKLVIPVPFRQTVEGKGFCLDASYTKTPGSPATFLEGGHARANRSMVAEPVNVTKEGKSQTLKAQYNKNSVANFVEYHSTYGATGVAEPVCTTREGKSFAVTATEFKGGNVADTLKHHRRTQIAEPVRVGTYPGSRCPECDSKQYRIYSPDGKIVAPCSVNMRTYEGANRDPENYEYTLNPRSDDKSSTLTQARTRGMIAEPIPRYATPTEWDESGRPVKATSGADGKEYTVYPVEEGRITIKGKTYPIKLVDGFYIIRKLTVSECKRLQTVSEWYDFSCVSNTQAYKMLGNGWTCEVIAHLMLACMDCEPLPDYLM